MIPTIGIDLGVRSVHISAAQACATITVGRRDNRGDELLELKLKAESWLSNKVGPVWDAWVEEPVVAGARNLRTSLQMAQVAGVLASFEDSTTHYVPVSTWKSVVVGRGNASKEDVARWLADEHPVLHALAAGSQDLVDATCLRLYGRAGTA